MVSKPLLAKIIPVLPTRQGSFRLFRLAGIDVHLHWSWFLIAAYQVTSRDGGYTSPAWNAVEYLALFSIVLMHEFGHALACRQVGGQAELIVLWPLGGVAYVNPPQRPGATLWSIAAGPLVNVVLVGVLSAIVSSSSPERNFIPITPVAERPIARSASSSAVKRSDMPFFEMRRISSLFVIAAAATTSSLGFKVIAISPPVRGESYSESGLFLMMPLFVAITR